MKIVLYRTRPVDASVRSIVAWAYDVPCLGRSADAGRLWPGVADAEFLAQIDGVIALGGTARCSAPRGWWPRGRAGACWNRCRPGCGTDGVPGGPVQV